MPDERPFMELTAEVVYKQIQNQGEALIRIDGRLSSVEGAGTDRETRVRKLELRYYTVLAAVLAGYIANGFVIARGYIG